MSYPMTSFKAAAIQLNSQPDVKKSMKEARKWVEKAAADGARLICLPENFAFLGQEKEKYEHAAQIEKEVESQIPQWAADFGVALLGGGYPASAGNGKIYNRSVLYRPDGTLAASYHKMHLFDAELSEEETYRESDTVQPGAAEAVCCDIENLGRIGFSICYDVRFPELYRKLSQKGTDIITVPSAFTKPTGAAHWQVLLRARAIENSAYVIAPAQTGTHGKNRETYGHSMIINPWGKVLKNAGTAPGFITAWIDPATIEEARRKLPALKHRRL